MNDDTASTHPPAPAGRHGDENRTADENTTASGTANQAFLPTDELARPALCAWLVPTELLVTMASVVPLPPQRPQGGGAARVSERDVFTAMVYVLTMDTAWRRVPSDFGVAVPTVYRRFVEWSDQGVWDALRSVPFDDPRLQQWVHTIADAALARVPVTKPPDEPDESWSASDGPSETSDDSLSTSDRRTVWRNDEESGQGTNGFGLWI
jgi:transposase